MMHKDCEKKYDRQRNADQPKKCTFSKTHRSLLYSRGLREEIDKVPIWKNQLSSPTLGLMPAWIRRMGRRQVPRPGNHAMPRASLPGIRNVQRNPSVVRSVLTVALSARVII
jgi:hypothetical protein